MGIFIASFIFSFSYFFSRNTRKEISNIDLVHTSYGRCISLGPIIYFIDTSTFIESFSQITKTVIPISKSAYLMTKRQPSQYFPYFCT